MSILATRELNKQVLIVYLQVSGSLSYVSWLIPRSDRQYRVNVDTMKVVIKSDCAVKVTFVCKMLKLEHVYPSSPSQQNILMLEKWVVTEHSSEVSISLILFF